MYIFNVVPAKDYPKYVWHDAEPAHISISRSWGTGKSHLATVTHDAILKHCFIIV